MGGLYPKGTLMKIGRMLGIIGVLVISLCCPVHSTPADEPGHTGNPPTAASAQTSKATGGHAVAPNGSQGGQAGSSQPGQQTGADSGSKPDKETGAGSGSQPVKGSGLTDKKAEEPPALQWTSTILDKVFSWVVVTVIFLLVFRKQLAKLIASLTDAVADRGVTLEVAKVKIQVSERAQQLNEDRGPRFSVSPLDLAKDPYNGFANTIEMPPQVTFQVSDYAARWWFDRNSDKDKLNKALSAAIGVVESKIAATIPPKGTKRLQDVKTELVACATALEMVHFVDAPRFTKLIAEEDTIRRDLVDLAQSLTSDPDDLMMVHAAGVAYAQESKWADARQMLEPIAWIKVPKEKPGYLPAADAWLAAMYHDSMDAARKPPAAPDTFIQTLLDTTKAVVGKAQLVRGEIDKSGLPRPVAHNKAYYIREIDKIIGTVASFRADYLESKTDKTSSLNCALIAYLECVAKVEGEDPSPLDYNNLADTYRQLAAFDESQFATAHTKIDAAMTLDAATRPDKSSEDPTFLNTEAQIFIDEKKLPEAFRALTSVDAQAMIKRNSSSQDWIQYLDNQILAAKVACSEEYPAPAEAKRASDKRHKTSNVVRLSRGADVLEPALDLLMEPVTRITDDREQSRLEAELYELLGYVYLRLEGYAQESVASYQELVKIWEKVSATAEVQWRRRLVGMRAYTQRARVARRDFDYGTAANQRQRGREVIDNNTKEFDALSPKNAQPAGVRLRTERMKLDTAMALQGLAEESFHGGEIDCAKRLLDKKDSILADLGIYGDREKLGENFQLAEALTGLLRGWLVFRSDPGTYEQKVLTEIEKYLIRARGQNPTLDCQVDLILGEACLAAALNGSAADAAANYRKAITALEFAAGREAPELRGDSLRALTDAYAKSGVVQRRTKETKKE
jgi:hypothetical protein